MAVSVSYAHRLSTSLAEHGQSAALVAEEARRDGNYPIARWYLRPAAGWVAKTLEHTSVRPWHVTLCGFACALSAAAWLLWQPDLPQAAALLVLGWWFCDRTDGQLARRRGTASRLGAWLDGNVDELADVGLHTAVAAAASVQGGSWAWPLLIAFLAGKYLFMYGLQPVAGSEVDLPCTTITERSGLLRKLYHLPGNADVRVHLLVLALLAGCLSAELALVAAYYNLRWAVRYVLVIRRERGQPA